MLINVDMGKHAYLIMAHGNFSQLKQLLSLLDDKRNDLYLHIDSKAGYIDKNQFTNVVGESNLFFIKRRSVTWGGDSQIRLEMDLLESAVHQEQYDYIHLLSGVDFPIKSKKYIFDFFEKHKGTEFVMIDKLNANETAASRCNKHYVFQNKIGRKNKLFYKVIQQSVLWVETWCGVNRLNAAELSTLRKGPNWFSITGDFAKYVVNHKGWILHIFSHTLCADEVFLQTLLWRSPFKKCLYINDNLKYTNLRVTDWQRGNPYVWQNEDIEYLISSPYLFARKFDTVRDNYIFNRIKSLN